MNRRILGADVQIRTDSARIAEIVGDMFGSRHFAAHSGRRADRTFWCAVDAPAPWEFMIGDGQRVWGIRRSDVQDHFDMHALMQDRVYLDRRFSYDVQYDGPSRDTTLELLASHFQRLILRDLLGSSPDLLMVHAGVVSLGDRGVLIVAETAGGKSTLSLACTMQGMRFLGDDFALVDTARGVLRPFPRAVRLRRGAYELVGDFSELIVGTTVDAGGEPRYYVHPERIRPDALGEAVQLTDVILLAGFGDTPLCEPESKARAAMACANADCFSPKTAAMDLVWRWAELADRARCLRLRCGPPLETATYLMRLLESDGCD